MNKPVAIIMGAQKCGTTTLYHSLRYHPNIDSPIDPIVGNFKKEMDFFYEDENWAKGLNWYLSFFRNGKGVLLDASPNYLTMPICYERIYETFPHAKLIICLRNPIERALSQYNHYCQDMPNSKNWDWVYNQDFLSNLKMELETGLDSRDFKGFLLKGAYIKQIRLLSKFFGQSQIYITVMDKWRYNYLQELEKIEEFLGLEKEMLPTSVRHWRNYTVEPLSTEVKYLLSSYYKPLNEELYNYLGYEIPEWDV